MRVTYPHFLFIRLTKSFMYMIIPITSIAKKIYKGGNILEKEVLLQADKRNDLGKKGNKKLRDTGLIPGVIAGKQAGSVPITVKTDDLRRFLNEGRNSVVKICVTGDKEYTAKLKKVSYVSVKGTYEHVDFQEVL